jgi:hypothetical protein
MGQIADRDCGDLLESVGAEYLHFVQAADGHIGELAMRIAHDVDVVGDWPGVERFENRKGWTRIEDLGLAGILQREPDLIAVRCRRDVGAERTRLRHSTHDLVVGDGDDVRLGCKGRAHVAVFPVGREDRHAGAVGDVDPRLCFIGLAVQHVDVVFAADGDPDFLAGGREERLMRRTA